MEPVPNTLSFSDFLKFDQLFCDGETPETIEAAWRNDVEHTAETLFSSVDSNLSKVKAIGEQWLSDSQSLPLLGNSQEDELSELEGYLTELYEQKSSLNRTFEVARQRLDEQKGLREKSCKALKDYELSLKSIASRDPLEKVLIVGGRTVCAVLNTGSK